MGHEFTLRIKLPALDCDINRLVARLGAAGCTDALVGLGVPGNITMEVTREASSAEAAVRSAMADVKKAIPSARRIAAGPDAAGRAGTPPALNEKLKKLRRFIRPTTTQDARAALQRYDAALPLEPGFVAALENEMREDFLAAAQTPRRDVKS